MGYTYSPSPPILLFVTNNGIKMSLESSIYPFADINSLNTVEDIINEIDGILYHVQIAAKGLSAMDIRNIEKMEWYINRIRWVRLLYTRMEVMVRDA